MGNEKDWRWADDAEGWHMVSGERMGRAELRLTTHTIFDQRRWQ